MSRKVKALVVDDNQDIAESFTNILRVLGHAAEFCTDPRAALDQALQQRPNIVFLDIAMPHLNGYDVARSLRAHFPPDELCIVAITGHGDPRSRAESRRAGIDAHVIKPVDIDMLKTTIEVSARS